MGALTTFSFEKNEVRLIERHCEPWFVLADVCAVLEIGNPSQAASRLDDDEKITLTDTLIINEGMADPRVQALTIINESGLYSLIFTSRKPAAHRFKKWVTAEVLPAIRKTGRYETQSKHLHRDPMPPEQLVHRMLGRYGGSVRITILTRRLKNRLLSGVIRTAIHDLADAGIVRVDGDMVRLMPALPSPAAAPVSGGAARCPVLRIKTAIEVLRETLQADAGGYLNITAQAIECMENAALANVAASQEGRAYQLAIAARMAASLAEYLASYGGERALGGV